MIQRRRGTDGLLSALAALAASAALIFVIVFRDQTLATVAESARIKYSVGPTIPWYQDFLRYYFLTVEDSVDGSLTRRFSVLILLLCLFGMLAVLLRRGGLPGMATGPVWRLIGATAVGLLLLTFTPTKWAVQFGVFAGIGGRARRRHRVRVLPGRACTADATWRCTSRRCCSCWRGRRRASTAGSTSATTGCRGSTSSR